jgi:Rad3-related DNA helicase
VLVSPSSTEGLDLKDDLSRFQIICKIHWPYLGDKLVKSRMEKYRHWYAYQAVKSLIQARGRSIRTEEDYAVTYILDDAFDRLYSNNLRMFPKYFRRSLHMDL